jgi:hypothetical protein
MGSGDGTHGRRLRLERETLRDLAPTPAEAGAVRGGDSATSNDPRCRSLADAMRILAGSTMSSYGCRGTIKHVETDTGPEFHVDLHPNDAVLEMHEMIKLEAMARLPELGEHLNKIGKGRFG